MTSTSLRKIEPMSFPAVTKATVEGARPKLKWVNPTDLLVDGTYQRGLSKGSVRLIRELVQTFSWSQMKPPITVEVAGGLHVVDGQHTAIAAATVGLDSIPIFIIDAPMLVDRAKAFIGHNRNRVAISRLQILNAMIAAGDEDALDVQRVCQRAGVRLRESAGIKGVWRPGDTASISTVQRLIARSGVISARRSLEVCAKAKLAPIGEAHMLAVESLLKDGVSADELTAVLRVDGETVVGRAASIAKAKQQSVWRAVADLLRRRVGKESK